MARLDDMTAGTRQTQLAGRIVRAGRWPDLLRAYPGYRKGTRTTILHALRDFLARDRPALSEGILGLVDAGLGDPEASVRSTFFYHLVMAQRAAREEPVVSRLRASVERETDPRRKREMQALLGDLLK
jgi:hypothetical protein